MGLQPQQSRWELLLFSELTRVAVHMVYGIGAVTAYSAGNFVRSHQFCQAFWT